MASTCESSTDLLIVLQTHFGHKSFRPGQHQVITTVLAGQDVLAVMPTGSGKSLGYQLAVDPEEVERRRAIEHRRLRQMVAYAEARGCLRAAILRYFGDPAIRDPCASCSNCQPHAARIARPRRARRWDRYGARW